MKSKKANITPSMLKRAFDRAYDWGDRVITYEELEKEIFTCCCPKGGTNPMRKGVDTCQWCDEDEE